MNGSVKVDKWTDKDTGKNRQAHSLLASAFWHVEGGAHLLLLLRHTARVAACCRDACLRPRQHMKGSCLS